MRAISVWRWAFVWIALGTAGAFGPAPVAADSDCSAKCSCACMPDYSDCAAFCVTGYFAQCRDGFCGGSSSSCCCILQGPLPPTRSCSGADCGAATVPCAALRSRPEKSACLDLLGAPSEEARWILVETEPVPGTRDHTLRVRFASSPLFQEQIEACHRQGLLPDSLFDAGLTRTFRFVPPRGTFQMAGRRLRLNIPPGAAEGLSGQAAVELIVDARGGVQSKELLFSSDLALGQRTLEGIGSWIEVASRGDTPGPYMDVFYLTFGADGLEVAIQNHYSLTAADSTTRLASRR